MKFIKGGPNLEVDFRYTNFFLASDPPPPRYSINQPLSKGLHPTHIHTRGRRVLWPTLWWILHGVVRWSGRCEDADRGGCREDRGRRGEGGASMSGACTEYGARTWGRGMDAGRTGEHEGRSGRRARSTGIMQGAASRSQSAPHMHVPVCICSNVRQS